MTEPRQLRYARRSVLGVTALTAFLWVPACGDGGTEPEPAAPSPPRPTTLFVTSATTALTGLDATAQLQRRGVPLPAVCTRFPRYRRTSEADMA